MDDTKATEAKRGLLGIWIDNSDLGQRELRRNRGDKEAAIDNFLALHEAGFIDIIIKDQGGENVSISVRLKAEDDSYTGPPRNRHERRAQKRRR